MPIIVLPEFDADVNNICLQSALIESDAEGIGGSGFIECIREHINSVCDS